MRARCTIRQPKHGPNKTEAAYDAHLHQRLLAGEIQWYAFERLKLRLADNTFYTPDFTLLMANGQIQIHEVKGFWQDDARVKIKVAADQFPWLWFRAVKALSKKAGGGWDFEDF